MNEYPRDKLESIRELVGMRDLSVIIGVPYETLRTWVKKRKIPYIKLPNTKPVKFHLPTIREWYNSGAVPPLKSADNIRCEEMTHDFRGQKGANQQEPSVGILR